MTRPHTFLSGFLFSTFLFLSAVPAVAGHAGAQAPGQAAAQSAAAQLPGGGTIQGTVTTVTTNGGTVLLPGVVVTLATEAGQPVAETTSDTEGAFEFTGLAAGEYRVTARLAGFRDLVRDQIALAAGQQLALPLEIALVGSERVIVRGRADDDVVATASSRSTLTNAKLDALNVRGDDFLSVLPILPGVVRNPDGRINMKGGRPSQTGLQLGQSYMSDPATGNPGFTLPSEAIASVEVFPNPYTAEYGRFSSGVTSIETLPGTNEWQRSLDNFIPFPCLHICNGQNWGPRHYEPRGRVAGPLIKDRLFLSQSARFRYRLDRVPSLPDRVNDIKVIGLDSFTRLDAPFERRQLIGTLAIYPRKHEFVNLNTFNPQIVTPDFEQRGFNVEAIEIESLGPNTLLKTTFDYKKYDVTAGRRRDGVMTMTPNGNVGSFFNLQERQTDTFQLIESFQTIRHAAGEHLFKGGIDVLHVSLDGTTDSEPVEIRRLDGTLARRLEYSGDAHLASSATDVGLFVQDSWRLNDRVLLELGLRGDRDGVIEQTSISPRAGAVLGVLANGRGIVRGGAGRFVDRTPLLAGAFNSMETETRTYFADDVVAPSHSVTYVPQMRGRFETASSVIWNVEYDQKVGNNWLFKVNHLRRDGRHELLVHPVADGTSGFLFLDSSGRSKYHETELTARYTSGGELDISVSYVRSRSEADLNAFDAYYGNFRDPIIQPNQYGKTNIDTPDRVVATAVIPMGAWLFSGITEIRDGFPYSIVDENQDFVGQRNAGGRFPFFRTLDATVMRRMSFRGRVFRVGVRVSHFINNNAPRDVQNNIDSPNFGKFYNSIPRRISLTFDLRTD